MAAIRFGTNGLLEYNRGYRILICRECEYAIQKSAVESHLLRHKIYRGDRQRLLSSISQLDLLEPDQVAIPTSGSPAIDNLLVISGYSCTVADCGHLTASQKRMKRHWSETHGSGTPVPHISSFTRPVSLQTFFRGNKVRYFEVASPAKPIVEAGDDCDDHDDSSDEEGRDVGLATPSVPLLKPTLRLTTSSGTTKESSGVDINLETLTCFYHFMTATCLTLPRAKVTKSIGQYWENYVVPIALRQRWMMCGLLAISSIHMAKIVCDVLSKEIHLERGAHFSSEFSAGYQQGAAHDPGFGVASTDDVNRTGEQISCLLRCAQWTRLAESALDDGSTDSCSLILIMSTIRGCIVPGSTLHESDSLNDNYNLQERSSESTNRVVQMEAFSHTHSSSCNTPSVLLEYLRTLPNRMIEVIGPPELPEDVFAVLSAISAMIECCHISFAFDEIDPAWQGMTTWLVKYPDHFNQMILRNNPAALVVLAYWGAVLVKRTERVGCWFLKGLANMIVKGVAKQLSTTSPSCLTLVEDLTDFLKD